MGTNARSRGRVVSAVATTLRVEVARQRLSIRELARRADLPYASVQKTLAGNRAIDIEELTRLATGLGTTSYEILRAAEAILKSEGMAPVLAEEPLTIEHPQVRRRQA